MHNEFEKEEKYKLYRTVGEILHPTISKKNISDYKIIIGEELLPIRVFYPKKVSNIKDIIIYIHGDSNITNCQEKYSNISSEFARELNRLVISIDYSENDNLVKIYETVKKSFDYIYNELLTNGISKDDITVIGDSTGGAIALQLVENNEVGNLLLFYPVLSGQYFGKTDYSSIIENDKIDHDLVYKLKEYYKGYENDKNMFYLLREKIKLPNTLLLIGNVDPLIDEAKAFSKLSDNIKLDIVGFANHGFLNTNDKEIKKDMFDYINDFFK